MTPRVLSDRVIPPDFSPLTGAAHPHAIAPGGKPAMVAEHNGDTGQTGERGRRKGNRDAWITRNRPFDL